jgi:MATE family multidrug resistance protein
MFSAFQSDIKAAWFLPNRKTFKDIWSFFKAGVPCALLFCLEFWCFELLLLISMYMTVEESAALVIILNTNFLFYAISGGIGIAASALVGREIGAKRVQSAQKYGRLI